MIGMGVECHIALGSNEWRPTAMKAMRIAFVEEETVASEAEAKCMCISTLQPSCRIELSSMVQH